MCKYYNRNGFLITRSGGSDAPWCGWREDGVTFRADTLQGAFQCSRHYKNA